MLSRRLFVGKVAAGAAAACAVGIGVAKAAPRERDSHEGAGAGAGAGEPSAAPELSAAGLLEPLRPGSEVLAGWRLADVSPVREGAFVVTLRDERGHVQRVHVCRNDGAPAGVAATRWFDLVLMNDGQGEMPTNEPLAHAVAELARRMRSKEEEGSYAEIRQALLSHAERVERFSAGTSRLLR